jgi:alpha-glucosidase
LLVAMITYALTVASAEAAQRAAVSSPDGRIVFEVWSEAGKPVYQASFKDEEIIGRSPLGLVFREAAMLDAGLALVSEQLGFADGQWEQPWGERRVVRDRHNELLVSFRKPGDVAQGFDVRVRMFDDGFGFRYELPLPRKAKRAITGELTGFQLDTAASAWWVPATEWNRYEYSYQNSPLGDVARVHTPLTLRLNSGTHVAIHEAALLDYSGMYLQQGRWGMMHARLVPGADGVAVHKTGAFTTPWRTVQVADNATGLVNSDLILNLNEPNRLGDVSWVKPGKYIGVWWGMHIGKHTWGSGAKHGATTERTRRYMDFAAEHGFDGVLVEGWNTGWDGDWFHNGAIFSFTESYPDFDIAAVTDHGRQRGVRLIGHHETSGHLGNYESQLEDALELYQRHGVTQIKTGYVADAGDLVRFDAGGMPRREWHYGQYAVNHHTRVLEAAAKRGISINTHEPVKDTGLRRSYPNWLSREGARGQEYNAWATPPNDVDHMATLVFTRMLSGPMDFTPGIFDLMPNGPDAESRVQTTLARQLAAYVVLYSPVQMAADLPENYLKRPDAFAFIKAVPTDWEQSIALAGEVGEYALIARRERGGQRWFLGGVTDEEARRMQLKLDFLEPGKRYRMARWGDAADAHWKNRPYAMTIDERTVRGGDSVSLFMAPGGGIAAMITPLEN